MAARRKKSGSHWNNSTLAIVTFLCFLLVTGDLPESRRPNVLDIGEDRGFLHRQSGRQLRIRIGHKDFQESLLLLGLITGS